MKLYEIKNPSDCVTFHAPDDATAVAVVLSVGVGRYAAERCEDGAGVGGLLLFATAAEAERRVREWLGGEDFETWCNAHREALADALLDCATVPPGARPLYDEACARQDSVEELEAFRRAHEDKARSSLTDIAGCAWVMGKALRRQA